MRRLLVPFLFLTLLLSALPLEAEAGMPLFDPTWHIVPDAHELDPDCAPRAPLGFGGALQLIQNLMNAGVSVGVVISVLVITFAGILFMLTPANPENHSKAKKILGNAVMGFLIVLAAWLIVDFVMKVLYDYDNTDFGPWNTILIGGDYCVVGKDNTKLFEGVIGARAGLPGQIGPGAGDTLPNYTTSGACAPASVQSGAKEGGITMPLGEAKFLACVARPESRCGASLKNYAWGKGSSAYGPFQILLDGHSECFDNAVCSKAAGVSGNLNCTAGFKGGNPIPGSAIAARCMKAAANLACSSVAAHCVYKKQGHGAWTKNKDSTSKHQQCIAEINKN